MVLAPSWSPLISITPLPHIDTPLSCWSPCFVPVDLYESPMLKPSEWHKQKVAEQSAHLEEDDPFFLCVAHCELCDIGIGPGHLEQDLYVYHVYDHAVLCIIHGREHLIEREAIEAVGGHWFLICGGCARSKRRNLPPSQCVFDSRHWITTLLIAHTGEPIRPITHQEFPTLWEQKMPYLTRKLADFGLSPSWFLSKEVEHLPAKETTPWQAPIRPTMLASRGMSIRRPNQSFAS